MPWSQKLGISMCCGPRSLRSWGSGFPFPFGHCAYVHTGMTHHGRAKNLWQSVRRTSLRRLAEPCIRARETRLVTGIDHITECKQSHAKPDRWAVNRHDDGFRKCDQSIDKISAKHITYSSSHLISIYDTKTILMNAFLHIRVVPATS